MTAPLQLKGLVKRMFVDAVRRHRELDAIAEEVAERMVEEIEAMAQDRIADLAPKLERGDER